MSHANSHARLKFHSNFGNRVGRKPMGSIWVPPMLVTEMLLLILDIKILTTNDEVESHTNRNHWGLEIHNGSMKWDVLLNLDVESYMKASQIIINRANVQPQKKASLNLTSTANFFGGWCWNIFRKNCPPIPGEINSRTCIFVSNYGDRCCPILFPFQMAELCGV